MVKSLSAFILRLFGWKIKGRFPYEEDKTMVIVLPHTSNWDFPIGILVRTAIGVWIRFVAKDSLFKPPFGALFRWMGGYPVDRSKRSNYVEEVIKIYRREKSFHLVIAPEGTRKKVDRLKTGFYYIALGAHVPIVMVKFDWETKEVVFREPFFPTGDKVADFEVIYDYYRGVQGKIPENGFLYDA